jgi:cell division septation protein DedD
MKNTSILIPIILIGCLAALIYLFFAALQATDGEDSSVTDRIVLNPSDYTDEEAPADIGQDADFEPYFQEVPDSEKITASQEDAAARAGSATTENNDRYNSGDTGQTNESGSSTATATTTTAPKAASQSNGSSSASSAGRYLVIAGSFRQLDNGKERVAALKAAGFRDTRLEKFNRGTFAVALAGQSNRYSEANRLAERVKAAGFEARVMRRR